jgi:hypothetical protein
MLLTSHAVPVNLQRIRAQNNELHAEEINQLKQTMTTAHDDKSRLETEVKMLKAKIARSSSNNLAAPITRLGEVTLSEGARKGPMIADQLHGGGKKGSKLDEDEVDSMQREIERLKKALSLALKAEELARKDAEHFTAASQQACETLQDRISSQFTHLTKARAENAMVIAQHRFDSSKSESERIAVEHEFKKANIICRRFFDKCRACFIETRPTGSRIASNTRANFSY